MSTLTAGPAAKGEDAGDSRFSSLVGWWQLWQGGPEKDDAETWSR